MVSSRIRQIIRLPQGTSKKQISVLTASSRNTVRKYISKFIVERLTYESIEGMSDYALDLLFSAEPPATRDEPYEELQLLLTGILPAVPIISAHPPPLSILGQNMLEFTKNVDELTFFYKINCGPLQSYWMANHLILCKNVNHGNQGLP